MIIHKNVHCAQTRLACIHASDTQHGTSARMGCSWFVGARESFSLLTIIIIIIEWTLNTKEFNGRENLMLLRAEMLFKNVAETLHSLSWDLAGGICQNCSQKLYTRNYDHNKTVLFGRVLKENLISSHNQTEVWMEWIFSRRDNELLTECCREQQVWGDGSLLSRQSGVVVNKKFENIYTLHTFPLSLAWFVFPILYQQVLLSSVSLGEWIVSRQGRLSSL